MSRRSRSGDLWVGFYEMMAELFSVIPAWTAIPIALIAWGGITCWGHTKLMPSLHLFGDMLGVLIGLLILAGGFAGWRAQRQARRFLDTQVDCQWVEHLSWRDFEMQVAAVYQRRGYTVQLLGGNQPDGGVDVRLTKNGCVTLVQCKHWKQWKVGVKVIRELFGVMTAEGAHEAILITSGKCTQEARRFAEGKPITVIEQDQFIGLVREFQRDLRLDAGLPGQISPNPATASHDVKTSTTTDTPPACPRCGSPMVQRTARNSAHAGNSFWGCPRFPACRGIRQL